MKTIIRIHLLAAIGLLALAGLSPAQQMPQDNWRYDGLEFSGPDANKPLRSIAMGSGGVYVGYGDPATSIVQFTENGVFIREFGTFVYILGIACDSSGNVYVLDRGDSKVKVFGPAGNFLREWGAVGTGDGQFALADASGVAMVALDTNNQIYLCDPGNSRVQVFDGSGNFLRKWGSPGLLPSQFPPDSPYGVAAHPNGMVYLHCAEPNPFYDPDDGYDYLLNPRLKIYNGDGSFISSSIIYNSSLSDPSGISQDGLFVKNLSYLNIVDLSLNRVSAQSGGRNDNRTSSVFNRRGDLFITEGPKVRVYEREYSTVHNALVPAAIPQPIVLSVSQRAGTPLLDIDYKIVSPDNSPVHTALLGFLDGEDTLSKVIPLSTFAEGTGANIGANQTPNVLKRVTWEMAADWSADFGQLQIEALARGGASPLGIHWITIPASGGQPAIEVSRKPVEDTDLLSVWYWLIANREPGFTLADGIIKPSSGFLDVYPLAAETQTTVGGRWFMYQKLGFRPISELEIARAQAGNYGFTSVDENSVVREAFNPSGNFAAGTGSNYDGQLGDWRDLGLNRPILTAMTVSNVSAADHTMFLKTDGTLWAVGPNEYGQLGDGTTETSYSPVQVASGVTYVSAGRYHTMFIKTDGTLWAMGYNEYGQLGDGTNIDRHLPVQVATGVGQVDVGYTMTMFIKTNSTLWAMGYNEEGALGDGTYINRSTPVQVSTNVAQVSVGGIAEIVKGDGTLWTVGEDPTQLATGVAEVSVGGGHTMFVKTDGTLWAYGYNDSGQLGDGTTIGRDSPVQVATGVSHVSAGNGQTMFIKTDNTLWAMGDNYYGQLGDGTRINRHSPVQVAKSAVQVSAGTSHSVWVVPVP